MNNNLESKQKSEIQEAEKLQNIVAIGKPIGLKPSIIKEFQESKSKQNENKFSLLLKRGYRYPLKLLRIYRAIPPFNQEEEILSKNQVNLQEDCFLKLDDQQMVLEPELFFNTQLIKEKDSLRKNIVESKRQPPNFSFQHNQDRECKQKVMEKFNNEPPLLFTQGKVCFSKELVTHAFKEHQANQLRNVYKERQEQTDQRLEELFKQQKQKLLSINIFKNTPVQITDSKKINENNEMSKNNQNYQNQDSKENGVNAAKGLIFSKNKNDPSNIINQQIIDYEKNQLSDNNKDYQNQDSKENDANAANQVFFSKNKNVSSNIINQQMFSKKIDNNNDSKQSQNIFEKNCSHYLFSFSKNGEENKQSIFPTNQQEVENKNKILEKDSNVRSEQLSSIFPENQQQMQLKME